MKNSTALLFYGDVPKFGYNGAVLKTDVSWKTWPVGSNPTVTASNKHFIGFKYVLSLM